MPDIYMRVARDLPEICLFYDKGLPDIYVRGMPEICLRHTLNMFDMLRKGLQHPSDMTEICLRYA